MLNEDLEVPKRRRTTAQKYIENHRARALVRDSQRALSDWQTKVARLRALMTLRRDDFDHVRQEAGQLLPVVVASRIQFEQAIEIADVSSARHSLVRDIGNAFMQLEDELLLLSSTKAMARPASQVTIAP